MTKSGLPKSASSSGVGRMSMVCIEERVVRPRANHPYLDPIFSVPAGEAVKAVHPLADIQVIAGTFAQCGVRFRIKRYIHCPPPDILFGSGVPDDPLVFGRTTGLHTRVGYEPAVFGDAS